MATRCGITTLSSFKKAIQDLPDDYLIGTNTVGNIQVYKPTDDKWIVLVGFIELTNLKFVDDNDDIQDCELTQYSL